MWISEEEIKKTPMFIERRVDLSDTHGFIVIGYFPYHCKAIRKNVRMPRHIFKELEYILGMNHINDNKFVIVCKDTEKFATEDFAINFKDFYAVVGRWDEIEDY